MTKMKGTYMRFISMLLMMALFSFLTVGCGEKEVAVVEPTPEPVEEVYVEPEEPMEPEAPMMEVAEESYEVMEGRTNGPMLPIYFDFDKSNIRDDQVQRLEANAAFLKDNPNIVIRVEGNCDERGTNEYNMALGDRRAQSAKKYLMNLGVSDSQLDTISFGEEKPLNYGHNELAWSQNRRDDFVIMSK